MAKKGSVFGLIDGGLRLVELVAKEAAAAEKRKSREKTRQIKAAHKIARENEKISNQKHRERMEGEARDRTRASDLLFEYLNSGIMAETFNQEIKINFNSLIPEYNPPELKALPPHLQPTQKPDKKEFLNSSGRMPIIGYVFPLVKRRWYEKINAAEAEYQKALNAWELKNESDKKLIAEYLESFEDKKQQYENDFRKKREYYEKFYENYLSLRSEYVCAYSRMILEKSKYSVSWNKRIKCEYIDTSKELSIEINLPHFGLISPKHEFKYIKSRDAIESKSRKKSDVHSCYLSLIKNIAIRTLYEVCKADMADAISTATLKGYIHSGHGKDSIQGDIVISAVVLKESLLRKVNRYMNVEVLIDELSLKVSKDLIASQS